MVLDRSLKCIFGSRGNQCRILFSVSQLKNKEKLGNPLSSEHLQCANQRVFKKVIVVEWEMFPSSDLLT